MLAGTMYLGIRVVVVELLLAMERGGSGVKSLPALGNDVVITFAGVLLSYEVGINSSYS